MPAGFQVSGTHGVLQIDGDYRNLVLRSLINTTTTLGNESGVGTIGSRTAWISYDGIQYPLVALRSPNYVCVGEWDQPNSRFRVYTEGGLGTEVAVYVFGESGEGADYGLQVFDADGLLVFDATHPPLRVVHFQASDATGSVTLDSERDYAAVVSAGPVNTVVPAAPPNYILYQNHMGASVSGGTVSWGRVRLRADVIGTPGSVITTPGIASIMVVDVTGY